MSSAHNLSPLPLWKLVGLGCVFSVGLVWVLVQRLVSSPMHTGEESLIKWLQQ